MVNNPDLTRVNGRVDIGFGFELKVTEKVHWYIEPMLGYTLSPVYTEGSGEYRQYVAGINIGVGL